tara:strand:+ start:296 stop:493 length:198 start_codon:yes stop_codon:yes gene_type:complete
MDELDTPATFARMEKRFSVAALRSADPASICVSRSIVPIIEIRRVLRVVHDVWGWRLAVLCIRHG